MEKPPLTAVIVGAGHRSIYFACFALKNPNKLKIVAVAEPSEVRRKMAADMFNIPPEKCFNSVEEMAKQPALADAAINGTMDHLHVPTTILLMNAGYDVLLEKPIAPSEEDLFELVRTSRKMGRKIMICHVLRYAPFYREIRQKVLDGEIGNIIQIHAAECVSYHHMALGYVRGKWNHNNGKEGSSMLLAKSCHDLDLIAWLKSGIAPKQVSSFGCLMYFRPENAPPGAGTRCLVDCKIESTCPYSAKKNYIEQGLWGTYVWHCIEHLSNPVTDDADFLKNTGIINRTWRDSIISIQDKIESLKTDNPHGRCVWRCDNNVVDHQTVIIDFEDGTVASFDMVGGVAKGGRYIHLFGTKGEIQGCLGDDYFVVRKPDARKGHEYSEVRVDLKPPVDEHGEPVGHGGGDILLMDDFIHFLRGARASISRTDIIDSVHGHQIVYTADRSMEQKKTLDIRHFS